MPKKGFFWVLIYGIAQTLDQQFFMLRMNSLFRRMYAILMMSHGI